LISSNKKAVRTKGSLFFERKPLVRVIAEFCLINDDIHYVISMIYLYNF
jgi:hypothetical protein